MSRPPVRTRGQLGRLILLLIAGVTLTGSHVATAGDRTFTRNSLGTAAVAGVIDISGTRAVWTSGGEVYLHNLDGTTTRITSTGGTCDPSPQIDGGLVVYAAATPGRMVKKVYLYDIGSGRTYPVTTDFTIPFLATAEGPAVAGTTVVFSGIPVGEDDHEIFRYDVVRQSVVRLTSNRVADAFVSTDGAVIAWQQGSATRGTEIARTTVTGTLDRETIVSTNVGDDSQPRVDRGRIVWYGDDGNDLEIYLWDGSTARVTDNAIDDLYPDLSGSLVVWESRPPGEDSELSYKDLAASPPSVKRVTDDASFDRRPRIDGRTIAASSPVVVGGSTVNVDYLLTETRAVSITSDGLPYQGFAYAYYVFSYNPSSETAYAASAYAYYAYAYAIVTDWEFASFGSVRDYYTLRYLQAYYSYVAAYYAYYATFLIPGPYSSASIDLNYQAFDRGYLDYLNR